MKPCNKITKELSNLSTLKTIRSKLIDLSEDLQNDLLFVGSQTDERKAIGLAIDAMIEAEKSIEALIGIYA